MTTTSRRVRTLVLLILAIVVAFGLMLRLTSSTRGIGPAGDLIAMSAILLRLLIHLRLKGSPDLEHGP